MISISVWPNLFDGSEVWGCTSRENTSSEAVDRCANVCASSNIHMYVCVLQLLHGPIVRSAHLGAVHQHPARLLYSCGLESFEDPTDCHWVDLTLEGHVGLMSIAEAYCIPGVAGKGQVSCARRLGTEHLGG